MYVCMYVCTKCKIVCLVGTKTERIIVQNQDVEVCCVRTCHTRCWMYMYVLYVISLSSQSQSLDSTEDSS